MNVPRNGYSWLKKWLQIGVHIYLRGTFWDGNYKIRLVVSHQGVTSIVLCACDFFTKASVRVLEEKV